MSVGCGLWRKYFLALVILVILVNLSEAHRAKLKSRNELFKSRIGNSQGSVDNSYSPHTDYVKGRRLGKNRFGKSLEGVSETWNGGHLEEQPQESIRLERVKDHKVVARWKVPETHQGAPVEAYIEDGVLRVRSTVEREGQPLTVEDSLKLPLKDRLEQAEVSTKVEGEDVVIRVSTKEKWHHKHEMFLQHLGEDGRKAYKSCKKAYKKDMVRIGSCICGNMSSVDMSVACYDHLVNISAFYAEKFGCTNGSKALKDGLEVCLSMSDPEQHLNCSMSVYDKIIAAWDILKSSGKMKKWKRQGIPEHLQEQVTRVLMAA
jgi:hypothetical protein